MIEHKVLRWYGNQSQSKRLELMSEYTKKNKQIECVTESRFYKWIEENKMNKYDRKTLKL